MKILYDDVRATILRVRYDAMPTIIDRRAMVLTKTLRDSLNEPAAPPSEVDTDLECWAEDTELDPLDSSGRQPTADSQ